MKFKKISFCICCFLLMSACGQPDEAGYSESFFADDTFITFTAYGDNAEKAVSAAREKFTESERLWSVTNENSEIYALNHSGGQAVNVSAETAEILEFALDMSERTGGALDPTVYPILRSWGFTTDENRIPSDDEIKDLLPLVGYGNVGLNGVSVRLPENMMIDLGSVGKGFAGDMAAEILRENGIDCALLDIGGNILTVGSKPDGSDWRVGIKDPDGNGNAGVICIADKAAASSGNYERFFIGEDGKKYGHIIDPSTGYPVDNDILSVTIISDTGRSCDALSTAVFVMGLEKGIKFWQNDPFFDMIIITKNREIFITENIFQKFTTDNSHSDMRVNVISNEK